MAFGISADQAGDALPQLMNALSLSLDETTSLADAINHLSNNMASGAPKVLDFVQRIGAQAKTFGFAAEQTAAFGSAMIAAGFNADVAATSFKNMGLALKQGDSASERRKAAFVELKLTAKQVAEDMAEDAVGTTLDVFERLRKIPEAQRAALMSDLFGNEAAALAPLSENTEALHEALGLVADETATRARWPRSTGSAPRGSGPSCSCSRTASRRSASASATRCCRR